MFVCFSKYYKMVKICDICGYSTTDYSNFRRHVKAKHSYGVESKKQQNLLSENFTNNQAEVGGTVNGNSMGMSQIGCKAAISSNTAKAIGNAVANQLVESGANIATDALMGNDVNESMHRELQNTRQNAAVGIQNLKRCLQMKRVREPPKKRKKKPKLILPIPGRDRPLIWED